MNFPLHFIQLHMHQLTFTNIPPSDKYTLPARANQQRDRLWKYFFYIKMARGSRFHLFATNYAVSSTDVIENHLFSSSWLSKITQLKFLII